MLALVSLTIVVSLVFTITTIVLAMRRILGPQREVLNKLARDDFEVIDPHDRIFFRDIYDHTIRINEMANNDKEQLTSALEANFSMTSIYQNEVSKKIAGWAAIIGVPTMLAGIYGMNFEKLPGKDSPEGFIAAVAVMLAVAVGMLSYFRKKKWF